MRPPVTKRVARSSGGMIVGPTLRKKRVRENHATPRRVTVSSDEFTYAILAHASGDSRSKLESATP
jgi:hypothetical protein